MCGFVGFTNLKKDFKYEKEIDLLKKMNNTLSRRGPDEEQAERCAGSHPSEPRNAAEYP